jgi:hypothetical protein
MTAGNLWLSEVDDGNFTRVQVYTDTAAGYPTAG